MLKNVVIYGERCSGTNYLEELLEINFVVERIEEKYGWKHFYYSFNQIIKNDDAVKK